MRRPLHRSRGFLLAVSGLSLLLGMWLVSIASFWSCHVGIRARTGGSFMNGNNVMLFRVYWHMTDPGSFEPSLRFRSAPRDHYQVSLPAAGFHYGPPINPEYREVELRIPHWLAIAIYLAVCAMLFAWRQRRLAAARAVEEAGRG